MSPVGAKPTKHDCFLSRDVRCCFVIAGHTFAISRQCDLWDGLIPKTIVASQVYDLRRLPLIERKWRLAKLIGKANRRAIRFTEHLRGDGPTVFEHVCRMRLEGIVSKRTDAPYRSGPSKTWVKTKNPASEAVRREREEEWR